MSAKRSDIRAGYGVAAVAIVQLEGLVHGYRVGSAWGGVILVVAAIVTTVMVKARKGDLPADAAPAHLG